MVEGDLGEGVACRFVERDRKKEGPLLRDKGARPVEEEGSGGRP